MFEDQNQQPSAAPTPSAQPVEDVFAETDAAPAVTPQAPAQSAPTVPPPGPPTALAQGKLQPSALQQQSVPTGQSTSGSFPVKKLILMIVVSVVVIGVAFAGVYIWKQSQSVPVADPNLGVPDETTQTQTQQSDTVVPDTTQQTNIPEQTNTQTQTNQQQNGIGGFLNNLQQQSVENAIDPFNTQPTLHDTDEDGLNDQQEYDLGTNPRLVDSDADGLSDWEEVRIFDTNPLHNDSDGDTYLDGEEVQNGYDPNGPGKLLDFESARDALGT